MRIDSDDFELFGLPRRFALDADLLDTRRRTLQAEVHPDRFASQGAAAQRVAMQWAVRVDAAWRNLKDPVSRATRLCELAGVPIDAERNTAMPPSFLIHQLEWRETLDGVTEASEVQALFDEVQLSRSASIERLRRLLDDEGDATAAAAEVRGLMFVDRFVATLEDRLAAIEG